MKWRRGPIIGRGSYATVYLAATAAGDLFAVKSGDLSNSTFLQKEQRFLSKLSSPNVISYMGFEINHENNNKPTYNLFMEYAPGGTISDVIKSHGGGPLDESVIRSYTRQTLVGLSHLHSNNLVHCDIKCRNILVGENGIVKIADLGCAKLARKNGDGDGVFSGTPVFMAPEVARGEEQGFASDVWALGCAVIEMATGSGPWPEVTDPVSALYRIGFSGDVPEFPRWLSAEGRDFLAKALRRDVRERWTVEELLRHPFVGNSNGCTRSSPTSVLDQDFWSSFEVPESLPERMGVEFLGESPAERINRLIGGYSCSLDRCLPNWEDEENWILIRSNDIEESMKICEEIKLCLFSSFNVEKMGGLDYLMMENYVVEGGKNVTNGFVSRFVDFENTIDDDYLLSDEHLFSYFDNRVFSDQLMHIE